MIEKVTKTSPQLLKHSVRQCKRIETSSIFSITNL